MLFSAVELLSQLCMRSKERKQQVSQLRLAVVRPVRQAMRFLLSLAAPQSLHHVRLRPTGAMFERKGGPLVLRAPCQASECSAAAARPPPSASPDQGLCLSPFSSSSSPNSSVRHGSRSATCCVLRCTVAG